MKTKLLLYTRKDCCLCEEMKEVVRQVGTRILFSLEEIDVDASPELCRRYGHEVPVLFINGRKAFKFRVERRELEKQLTSTAG
jgi:glutaredoxin